MKKSVLILTVLAITLTACTSKPVMKEETATPGQENEVKQEDTFTYELTAKNWNTEGITVKYPLFVNTNNQDRADILNELIMDDIGAVIDGITTNLSDTKGLTIDAVYDYSEVKNALLSISYQGTSFSEGAAYPLNFYHTITLDMSKGERVSLSDLFTIDNNFAEIFKMGAYVASNEDLDLEKSGLNVGNTISEQYTNEQLVALFSDPKANYFLQEDSLILSIEVPHAIGDYLEMAILYEGIEGNIKKEHPYWSNYFFLKGDTSGDTSAAGFMWKSYSNDEYGYALSYPDIYKDIVESDGGDGVTMASGDGKYSLEIWAKYNIDGSTATALLAEAKTKHAYISEAIAKENGYSLTFAGEGNGEETEFVEKCFVTPNAVVYYLISYMLEEKDSFTDVNARMESELYIE